MPLIKRKKPSLYNSYPWAEVNRTLAGLNFPQQPSPPAPSQWPNFAQPDMNTWMGYTCQSPVPQFSPAAWPPQFHSASAAFCPSPVFGMSSAFAAPPPPPATPPPMFQFAQYPVTAATPPPMQPYGTTRTYIATPPPYMQTAVPAPQPQQPAQAQQQSAQPPPPPPTSANQNVYTTNWGKQ